MANVAVIGNTQIPWATANDLISALENQGHETWACYEADSDAWDSLIRWIGRLDAVIWNRTPSHSAKIGRERQNRLLREARESGIPTIAVHLDRWWGLKREREVFDEPYFRCEYVFTADGHDPARWEAAGVNHHWMPPAIASKNAHRGRFREDLASDVAFIGSTYGYHHEWRHRMELIRWVRRWFGRGLVVYPRRGQTQVRGDDLNDLLASAKVIVGDSCLVETERGVPYTRYCSDRVFEIPGRGGALIHPYVEGVVGKDPADLMRSGSHLFGYELDHFDQVRAFIHTLLKNEDRRLQLQTEGQEWVRRHHTYERRLFDILQIAGVT